MLIVGLGNPGKKYEGTRHNLGFEVVDRLRVRFGLPNYIGRFSGEFIRGTHAGIPVMLLKPTTFMNISGSSVQSTAAFFKTDTKKNLWVVHDDLDLGIGRLRIRRGGGSGGHNGVKDVINRVGHADFARFRVGIGRPEGEKPVDAYVLEKIPPEEREAIDAAVERATKAVITALTEGFDKAMDLYSG